MEQKNSREQKLKGFSKSKSLDKYQGQILFKEKVEKANAILKTVGLPKS